MTWIIEMGLRIFLGHTDVELPQNLVELLVHWVDCEHGTVKIGDQHVGIKCFIPVNMGLPSDMDELPSVDMILILDR